VTWRFANIRWYTATMPAVAAGAARLGLAAATFVAESHQFNAGEQLNMDRVID
jgi:hypothetical protein